MGPASFDQWWTDEGSSPAKLPAIDFTVLAWDAAIRAAVLLLHDEKDRLVDQKLYERAAAVRDCMARIGRLFASPDKQNPNQHRIEYWVDQHKRFLRELSDQHLAEVRMRHARTADPMAIALEWRTA